MNYIFKYTYFKTLQEVRKKNQQSICTMFEGENLSNPRQVTQEQKKKGLFNDRIAKQRKKPMGKFYNQTQ